MSDALRPSSLLTSAPPATAPSGVLGTLPNPPPEVSQLPAGTTLRGTVVGQDDKGHLLVRTDLGTLAVSTKANLPPGSEVVLQIRSSGAQLHILLMQSDAAVGGAAQRGLPPGSSTLPTPPGISAPPPDQLTLGQSIRAILQTPAPLVASTGPASLASGGALDPAIVAAVARLAPGSQIVLRIISVEAPIGAPPGTPAGTTPQTAPTGAAQPASVGVTGVVMPGPIAGQGPATPLPIPGQAGTNSLPAGTPPGAPPGAPAATQPGLPGTIAPAASGPVVPTNTAVPPLGATPGQSSQTTSPVAATPASGSSTSTPTLPPSLVPTAPPTSVGAAYAAAQASPVSGPYAGPGGARVVAPTPGPTLGPGPVGPAATQITGVVTATTNAGHPVLQTPIGTLTLEVQASLPAGSRVVFELAPGALPRESASLPASLGAWPEIEDVIRVLHEATPSGATGPTTIPQPGSRLASGLLFFLAALSGGDMSRWLGGQAVQTLKSAGRDNLLARLGQDFSQLSRQVESGGADWRLFLIPMLDGSQVQQIRFFERHGSNGHDTNDDQKDGESTRFILEIELSRLGDMQIDGLVRDKRFDLMLRTRRPLSDIMRHDIIEIFTDANDAAGFVGTIGFQASRDWHFMPINEAVTASAESGLMI